jgi:hypothetical protein
MADAKKINIPATESPLMVIRKSIVKLKPTKFSKIVPKSKGI